MFDYQVSKQAHFDNACLAFANTHKGDLVQIAESIGMNAQMLRNKLNPEQPHQLTCIDLMKLTDATEDASILDGVLEQMQCQPSVPVNEVSGSNVPTYLLTAVSEVGKLATNTVSGGNLNNARVAEFKRSVNTAIRCLTLAGITLSARLHTNPAFACAVDAVTNLSPSMM